MNKKICFVSLNNLYLTPYVNKYIDIIDKPYDIIYWNRDITEENIKAEKIYSFNLQTKDTANKFMKFISYMKFKKFASKILRENDYDHIIVLQTSVGVLLKSILLSNFNKKYILDIRDYTFEKNWLFFKIVKKLVNNSSINVISSEGYKEFLPPQKYINVHNDISIENSIVESFLKENKDNTSGKSIRISYIGLIRFFEQNKNVILKFKNDSRFRISFIGKNANVLGKYCVENNINNVDFVDRFSPERTLDYYKDTDIIFNLYGNNSPLLDYALSNKLYYAAKLRLPILVCKDTYMEKISMKYDFGYVFDLDDPEACDKLYTYYSSINWDKLEEGCQKFCEIVDIENKIFEREVKRVVG